MNRLMKIYIKAGRWIFPKMPKEVFYECSKDLELFEKLCREDIIDEKRFTINDCRVLSNEQVFKILNQLTEENEQLKQDIENLKITINARETLIDVCEKKFKELDYIITVNDDGYVIE